MGKLATGKPAKTVGLRSGERVELFSENGISGLRFSGKRLLEEGKIRDLPRSPVKYMGKIGKE